MDFTPEQVADLNFRHGSPLHANQMQEFMVLLGGQPYLVRRALYLMASRRMSTADLFTHAADDGGPFGDHLRYHLFRLHSREDLIQGLRQVMRDNTCASAQVVYRLHSAGLVRIEGVRCCPAVGCTPITSGSICVAKQNIYTVGGTVQASGGLYLPRKVDSVGARSNPFCPVHSVHRRGASPVPRFPRAQVRSHEGRLGLRLVV